MAEGRYEETSFGGNVGRSSSTRLCKESTDVGSDTLVCEESADESETLVCEESTDVGSDTLVCEESADESETLVCEQSADVKSETLAHPGTSNTRELRPQLARNNDQEDSDAQQPAVGCEECESMRIIHWVLYVVILIIPVATIIYFLIMIDHLLVENRLLFFVIVITPIIYFLKKVCPADCRARASRQLTRIRIQDLH